jgi:hypothetical protein
METLTRWHYLHNVHTPREAQLFIERANERGFTIQAIHGLAARTYESNNVDPGTKKGAYLVLKELGRQRQAETMPVRVLLAIMFLIGLYVFIWMMYSIH